MSEIDRSKGLLEMGRESRIRELARKLQDRYHIFERFDLAEEQSELFNLYLMGYLTLTTDVATSDTLKRPEAEVVARVPLFRGIIAFMEKREQNKKELAARFFNEASTCAIRIKGQVTEAAIEMVAQKGNLSIEEIKSKMDLVNPLFESTVDLLLKKMGSSGAIRNAANLVCSTYRKVENEKVSEQDKTMERVLIRIKIKEENKKQY